MNFTWVLGLNSDKPDPFDGLGISKKRVPTKTEVHERVTALKQIWDSSRAGDGQNPKRWGEMGLTQRQLEAIEMRILDMEGHLEDILEDKPGRGQLFDPFWKESLNKLQGSRVDLEGEDYDGQRKLY
jgi:hypothetical protein